MEDLQNEFPPLFVLYFRRFDRLVDFNEESGGLGGEGGGGCLGGGGPPVHFYPHWLSMN